MQSNTAKRARKIAKPTWSVDEGRSCQDFSDLLREEAELNASVDFSFEYHYVGDGDWSNLEDYRVDVSNVKREAIPEKEAMSALDFAKQAQPNVQSVPITSITRKISKPQFPV